MAAVLDPKDARDAASKLGSQVDEQLAQATTRIRAHDLLFGALVLVSLVLFYAAAMILLDRYLNLPQWVRQVGLLGFVGAFAGTAYLTIVSPLRKKINPLYAARRVESTIEDAKNSVTGYVDAQERGTLNATVKAALASRAARSVAEADVNKAVDHRGLIYVGGVAVALFLTLVALFFVFRPAQFGSLVGRAFAPFTPAVIRTRTEITLVKPEPADPTITDGQTVTVAVYINGKVPSADSPERVRLLVRHNPADPNYTELPMVPGDTSRDWELRVPNHLVQSGFWYKVAAGDAETPEYKVAVRALPLFTRFQAVYEAPKYLRRPIEVVDSPIIQGYRGTTVLLTAGTNRDARDGLLLIEPGGTAVRGTPVTDDPKALHFRFTLQESGKYSLVYTTADGERSADPFRSTITVTVDSAPVVVIDKPEDDELTLPANGQLAVDGKAGDDFGVDTVTLKMRLLGPTPRPLPDRVVTNGKNPTFRREKDGTYPTDVDVKVSADFAALAKDAAGAPLALEPDMVVEYWLEATDNCTEPGPNVGRSAVKRVRLAPPVVEEPKKEEQNNQKNQRQQEEQKHNAGQKQKFDQEKRDQPQNKEQRPPEPKNGEPQKKDNGEGAPKPNDDPMGEKPQEGAPKQGDKKDGNPQNGTGGMSDKSPGDKGTDNKGMDNKGMPDATNPPKGGMGEKGDNPPSNMTDPGTPPADPSGNGGMGPRDTAPPPKSQEDKDVQQKADKLKDAIEQENKQGGTAKQNEGATEQERTDPAQPKPQPPMDNAGGMAEQKPDAKSDPMQKGGDSAPSAGKPAGNLEKPADPSAPKPNDPKAAEPKNGEPKTGDKGTGPAERRQEPAGAPSGVEKPQPGEADPKDPNKNPDPNAGGAKPSADPKAGGGEPDAKRDPAADAGSKAKPMGEPTRGGERPNDAKAKPDAKQPDPKAENKSPDAGEAKPDKAPPAATPKPTPKDGMDNAGERGAAEPKPEGKAGDPAKPDGNGAAETKPAKPDPKNPMNPGGAGVEKGTDKPEPKDNPGKPQGGPGDKKGAPKKPSEQEMKDLRDAADNLTSPDENRRKDAQQKLDKALGEQKRKEMEKLANDLQSPDEKTRNDARQKLEEMKKQAQQEAGKSGAGGDKKEGDKTEGAPKPDPKQQQEIADAVNDLQSKDDQKRQAAQKKLDKMVGEQARKDAEQLQKDLQSDDKATRDAAQKKLDDWKKQMENGADKKNGDKQPGDTKGESDKGPPGKEPTKQELEDLAKKAQDLQSKDEEKRRQAEKELDEKLGKENRERLQKEMEGQQPGSPEQEQKLREEMERMAKERAKRPQDLPRQGLGSGVPTKEAMEEDARNRLKSAELQLEQFERKKYDDAFKRKQGFTDEEYEKFLNGYSKYVEKLREDAKNMAAGEKPPAPGSAEPGRPITAGDAKKVEGRPGAGSGVGGTGTVDPPGFENARDKFQKLIQEKK